MLTLKFRDHTGKLWDLFDPDAPVGVPAGGLKLSAAVNRTTQAALGRPGVFTTDVSFGEMTGSLTATIDAARAAPSSLESAYLAWLSAHSPHKAGTLIAGRDGKPELDREADVKLAAALPNPDIIPENAAEIEVEAQLSSEAGAWFGRWQSATGVATVANSGDVVLAYRIRWSGAGGAVVLPSGASFTLPPTDGERIIWVSDDESCIVEKPDGTEDRAMWKAMAGAVLPEPIPVGKSALIEVPPGATLEWRLGWAHPWG